MSELHIQKIAHYMPIAKELLVDSVFGRIPNPPPPIPEHPGPHPKHVELLDKVRTNELLTQLLELHEPRAVLNPGKVSWRCEGEQPSGYEWEWPDWPCETVTLIAQALNVDLDGGRS